jgi:hypothetical protein
MRVCAHHGLVFAVLTRDEHCPPHVHVGTDKWEARLEFGFWDSGVGLWDVVPARRSPSASLLEELRQVLRKPDNLKKARQLWWRSRQTVCLENQHWDPRTQAVVSPSARRTGAVAILSAHFDTGRYRTTLILVSGDQVEIQL